MANLGEIWKQMMDYATDWNMRHPYDETGFEKEVVIQLPDNEPPVDFRIDVYDDMLVLMPIPPEPNTVWKHDTNVNDYGPAN